PQVMEFSWPERRRGIPVCLCAPLVDRLAQRGFGQRARSGGGPADLPLEVGTNRTLVAELPGDPDARFLNHRGKLPQPADGHPFGRAAYAEAGVYVSGVIPDGRRHAPDVRFILLEVEGVSAAAYPLDLLLQLLGVADGVRRAVPRFDLAQHARQLFGRQIS